MNLTADVSNATWTSSENYQVQMKLNADVAKISNACNRDNLNSAKVTIYCNWFLWRHLVIKINNQFPIQNIHRMRNLNDIPDY